MRTNKAKLVMSVALAAGMVAVLGSVALKTSDAKSADKAAPAPVAAPAATPAATAAAQTPPNNDWQSRCQDITENAKVTGKYCEAVQSLYVIQKNEDPEKTTTQRVAEMAVGYPPGSSAKEAQAVAILPLGIVVNEKVAIDVDGKDLMKFDIRFCDVGGCVGIFSLDKGDIEKMRKGKELSFKTQTMSGQPVVIGLPLAAFDTVIAKLIPGKK